MATYHGIVKIRCLDCGHESTSDTDAEMWNDYGGDCPRCHSYQCRYWNNDGEIVDTVPGPDSPDDTSLVRYRRPVKAGDRVRLISMCNDPAPIEPGSEGVVSHVDDGLTAHVNWDNGRHLGLVFTEDDYEIVERAEGA